MLQILTKDSVTVFVNAIMYYKVKDATLAVANVDDYASSAKLLAATTLRNVLGTMTLGDILCKREFIAREMKACSNYSELYKKIMMIFTYQDVIFRLCWTRAPHHGACWWRGWR